MIGNVSSVFTINLFYNSNYNGQSNLRSESQGVSECSKKLRAQENTICFLVEVATERMKGFELFLSQRVVKTKPMQIPFNI